MKRTLRRSNLGFTLLEIMLVVLIIGLLIGMAVKYLGGNIDIAMKTRAQGDIQSVTTQLMIYRAQNGFFPTTEQGLKALTAKPETDPRPRNWSQLMPTVPRDGWDMEYNYVAPGKHNPNSYDLFSSGPDRKPDTADDIGNWESQPTN
jgi:general secretion pathway protein G